VEPIFRSKVGRKNNKLIIRCTIAERKEMKILFQYCAKGDGKRNEDVIGQRGEYIWVIDGATDVFKSSHIKAEAEVYWYVHKLNSLLTELVPFEYSPYDLISKAVDMLYGEICKKNTIIDSVDEFELPTFAIALLKASNNTAEYYILGDCYVSYIHNGKYNTITDNRIEEFVYYNRTQLRRKGLDPRKDPEANEIYKETRKKANTEKGYYIGSVRGTGLKHGLRGTIALSQDEKIALFSDGFYDYFSNNPIEAFSLFNENDYESFIKRMDEYLQDESNFVKDLRPKQVDDRSLIIASF